jgi:hypothetical protein
MTEKDWHDRINVPEDTEVPDFRPSDSDSPPHLDEKVSFRVDEDLLDEVQELVGEDRPFPNRSVACRDLLEWAVDTVKDEDV